MIQKHPNNWTILERPKNCKNIKAVLRKKHRKMFQKHSNNWTILERPKNCKNIQSCFQEKKAPKNVSETPKNVS